MSDTGDIGQVHDRGSANQINIASDVRLSAPVIVEGNDNRIDIGAETIIASDDPAREVAGIEIR